LRIGEFQQLMRDLYYRRDVTRGKAMTMLWVVEEVGELAEAVRTDDTTNVAEELADVIAWVTSIANLYNLDLEEILSSKYPGHCPRCRTLPCECEMR